VFLSKLSLLRSLAIVLVPAVAVVATYHFSFNKPLSSAQVLQQVARDPEFIKYFGQGLASLDTDKDGLADAKDPDIDNDGTPNAQDPDIDNDGTPNAQDPSTALTALSSESEDQGLENKTTVAGKDGQDGADGANGNDGAAGVQGVSGTVGVVTDDGVIQTSLTGSDLDIQVLVAANSGLVKISTGLSLRTDCNASEVLQWGGSSWDCSTTSGGISYTSGSGISISSNIISSVLGSSIETGELNDGSVTTVKLADGSVVTSKITDSSIVTAKLSDGGVTTAKIADNAVSTAKIVDSAVTYAKLQNVAANSLIGNPTGSAASASEISLGQGLSISGSTLNNAGILTVAVSGPLTVAGGQNKTLGIIRATGLVDGYISASDFAQFSSKQAALTAGSGISLAGNTVSFDPATFSSVSSITGVDKLVVVTGSGTKNISYNDLFGGVLGSLNYRGSWDAAANTPNLTAACTTGTKGYYYVVSTAGTTSIDGSSSWNVGDWVVCNGSIFQQVQTTNGVSSVFGRTGTITAQNGDYTASQISNTPAGNISSATVQGAINQLDGSKLTASLADGLLYVGNSSGIASPVSLSGDATITNTGTLTIGSGAVTTAKIADGTITFADLASNSCSNGQIIKYNGSNWNCSSDNTVSTGDLTTSTNGLTVTGGTGSIVGSGVTLDIATAGTSQNGLLAATDWNTFNAKENALTFTGRGIFTRTGNAVNVVACANGEVLKYNGTLWQCGQDIDTTYSAGTGLSLSGSTFNLGNTSVTSGTYGAASSVPVLIVDAQGRLTGVTNTTISGLTTSNLSASAGITNAQLANPGITFALGTSGSDVAWGATTVNLGGTATLNIPDANATARGIINVSAQTIAGDKTLSGNTTFEGSFATKKGTDFSTVGTSSDVNFGNTSLVRLTGTSAQTITGIAGGVDGKLLTIINAGTAAASITNQDTLSVAANRITTGTGSAISLPADASLSLVYDAGASRWRVVGGSSGTGTSYASVDVANKATGGAIGTAATTVDVATNFNVDQTTTGQTLTIPSPTNTTTTKGKIVTINNVGTANFTLGSITVPAGSYGSAFVWTGSVWNPINAATNVAAQTVTSNITSGQTTTSTAYTDVTNGTLSIPTPGTYSVSYSVPFVSSAAGVPVSFQLTDSANAAVAGTAVTASAPVSGVRSGTATVGDIGTSVACASSGAVSSCSNALVSSGNRYTINYADLGYTPIVLLQYRDTLNTNSVANDMFMPPIVGTPTSTSAQFFLEENGANTQNATVYVQLINPNDTSLGQATLASVPVTFSAAGTYKLRYKTANANNTVTIYNNATEGTGYVSANLIGGNTPVAGQSVEYVNVTRTGTSQAVGAGTTVLFNTVASGNIPYNTTLNQNFTGAAGTFQLTAGKTYRLTSMLAHDGAAGSGFLEWSWHNNTTGTSISPSALSESLNNATNYGSQTAAETVFTPATNTLVSVRVNAIGSNGSVRNNYSQATITQLGSTNLSTGIALNTLTSAVANGSLDNTNYTQTWNYSTATTQTGLLALNANALTSGILQQLATSSTVFTGSLLNISSTGNNAAVTGSLAKFDIVGSSSAAKGLQINNAGTGDAISIDSTGTGLAFNASGAVAFKKGVDYTTVGSTNNVDFGNTSLVRLNGTSAQTITGIAGGTDGKLLTVINAGANAATISNESASSTAANRIKTGTGADLTLAPDASLSMVYDSGASRWRVVGGTGGSTYASVDITDKATGGAIGTAATTVDIATNFNVNQTTASQTLTIPSPTNTTTTKGKIVTLNNIGTASFTMGTVAVPAGSYGSAFVWTGITWNPINAASNVAGATFSASKSSTSTSGLTTVAGNTTTLQPTSARLPLSGAGIDTNASGVTVGANSITILQTGKYRLSGNWNTGNSSGQSFLGHQYIKNNATILPGGVFGLNDTTVQGGTSYSSSVDVDLVAGDIIDMRIYGNTSTSTNYLGYTFSASLISGNAPVVGQSVDYVEIKTADGTGFTNGVDLDLVSVVTGGIPVNTAANTITLTAGKTYSLIAMVRGYGGTGAVDFNFVDATTNAELASATGRGMIQGDNSIEHPFMQSELIYTPSTNQTVKVRGVAGSGTYNYESRYSRVVVTQLGSTNLSTGIALNTLTSAVANGSLDNTNYTQTWNYSTATTQTGLLALNANALTSGILQQLATSSTVFTGSLLNISSTGNNAAVTGSLAKFDIVGSSSAAKGLQINNAGTGTSLDVNNTGTGLAANFGGAIATKAGTTYTTPGSANDVAFANASYIRLDTSGVAQTITGIANGVDGKLLTLSNADASLAVTLSSQSTGSAAANRIVTGTGSDLTIAAGASVNLIYDATDSRWRVVGGTGGGVSSSIISSNFATGGAIGTAAATVDAFTSFVISGQTTTGQALSLPSPTVLTAGKIVTITNTSTASFTMYSTQLSASSPSASFIWTGSAWSPIGTSSNVASEFGEQVLGSNVTIGAANTSSSNTVSVLSFTLPSAGTWDVTSVVKGSATAAGRSVNFAVYDSTPTLVASSEVTVDAFGGASGTVSGTGITRITTTGPATYQVRAWDTSGSGAAVVVSDASGRTKVTWQKISGNTAVTGETVDYVDASLASNIVPVVGNTVPLATTSGNIPNTSGVFTLTAGKTYELNAYPFSDNTGSSGSQDYQWRDLTNNVFIGKSSKSFAMADPTNAHSAVSSARAIITPTTNITVALRATFVSGGSPVLLSSGTSAVIKQLGSTASTGVAMSSLVAAIANNSLDNTNYAQTWNWSLATTETGLAMNFNALTSGNGLALASTSTGLTGNLFSATSASTAAATNGLVRFNFTGAYTGNGVQIDSATASGTGLRINANSLTSGSGLHVTSTSTSATGNLFLVQSASTGSFGSGGVFFNFTGAHTGTGFQVNSSSVTGNAMALNTTASTGNGLVVNTNGLTTGSGISLTNSSSGINSTNGLLYVGNTTATTNGIVLRAQSSSTAGSGLTVLANGKVGIGTTSPTGATLQLNDATGEGLLITSTNAIEGGQVTFGGASGQAAYQIDNFNDGSAQDFRVLEGNTVRAYLTVGSNGWLTPSDARLKDNIMTLDNVLEKLEGVRGTSYRLKDSGALQIGVIAQDFKDAFPGVVSGDEATGLLGVSYDSVAAIAIQGIKELNMKVESNKIAIDGQILNGISEVDNKLAQINDGLTAVSGNVTEINTALDTVNQRIASLDGRLSALEQATPQTNTTTQVINNTITQTIQDSRQAGTAKISAGKIGVRVIFAKTYTAAPIVYLTPVGNKTIYHIENVTTSGFTIMLDEAATTELTFNWLGLEQAEDASTEQIDGPLASTP
jgi:Chaperone of endosialidase